MNKMKQKRSSKVTKLFNLDSGFQLTLTSLKFFVISTNVTYLHNTKTLKAYIG